MPKWDTAAQGSAGWLKAREGCLTASRMVDAMSRLKSGGDSEKRRQLKYEILAERLTGCAVEHYVNPAMQWGIEWESACKEAYEEHTGNIITPCGFALHDEIEYFGASPDGLINHDGAIECKCPTTTTHIKYLIEAVVPEQYKPQMLSQLAVTGRKWCDFASYDPRMPEPLQLFVVRFEPAPEDIVLVENAAREFLEEIDSMWELLALGREE